MLIAGSATRSGMSKFAKGKSWIENRLSSDVALDGRHYTVNLLARKGTGVQGFRMTVVYIPHEGGTDVEVDLPNAATTADVHRATRELTEDPARIARMFAEASSR
jgi:hypothetical protein